MCVYVRERERVSEILHHGMSLKIPRNLLLITVKIHSHSCLLSLNLTALY